MTALLVAERHDLVKAGIEAVLKAAGHLVVGDGLPKELDSSEIRKASIVILSQNVAAAGTQLPRQLKACKPSLCLIVLLDSLDGENAFELVGPEVEGVIMREAPVERLLECIDCVRAGRRWLDPELLQSILRPVRSTTENGTLTAREASISDLVGRGLRNKQIAREMRISESTVKMHLHHIYGKLHLSGRTELALRAPSGLRVNAGTQSAPRQSQDPC